MTTREDCAARDARDPLAPFRARFALPEGVIYLDGNSLGALPKAASERATRVIGEEWGRGLIRGWNDADWMELPFKAGNKIAQLVGAKAGEVVACDSTSVNLFKLLAAAFALRPERRALLTDSDNFPTDNYVAEGVGDFLGDRVERRLVPADEIIDAIEGDTAVVSLTHVNYRTGRIHDMAAINAAAAAHGALTLWDLSHSAGAVPLDLSGTSADLAVGCGYKYLNGGPGAPAYIFVAERHQATIRQPLSGWMGHAAPFEFADQFRPAPASRACSPVHHRLLRWLYWTAAWIFLLRPAWRHCARNPWRLANFLFFRRARQPGFLFLCQRLWRGPGADRAWRASRQPAPAMACN